MSRSSLHSDGNPPPTRPPEHRLRVPVGHNSHYEFGVFYRPYAARFLERIAGASRRRWRARGSVDREGVAPPRCARRAHRARARVATTPRSLTRRAPRAPADSFDITIFTASQPQYAAPLVRRLSKCVSRLLCRDSCRLVLLEGQARYAKDLDVVTTDPTRRMIVDNSAEAYALNPESAIPVTSWFEDQSDRELRCLAPFLEALAHASDVRSVLSRRIA